MHTPSLILSQTRTCLGRDWTGRQVKMQDLVSRAFMQACFSWNAFGDQNMSSLSSYAGKEPTFHWPGPAAVRCSRERGRPDLTQRKLYIFERHLRTIPI
ncbi:uncharacterized protein LOC143374916 [Andrena cerasifolii]|uniref:uncharacterized protein LOC143374916 n=1 Tax=Andrena cerasifolii TaxID=2819439 RepID=UPI004037C4EF